MLAQSTGGVGRHVRQIVEGLDGDGFLIDVAAPADLVVGMPKPVIPVAIPKGPLAGHAGAVGRLTEILKARRYDVVHGHGLRAGLDAAVAAKRAGVPAVVSFHNLVQEEISGRARTLLYRRLEPFAVRLADRVVAVSEQAADHLRRIAPKSAAKVSVVHVGVGERPRVARRAEEVRSELGLDPSARIVVTVARLVPQKALDVLLAAVALLPDDVHLAIVGDGRLRGELETHARASGIAPRAHFLGYKPDAADYVAAADVFCLSSVWEAVPLAAQEAVLLGVPVVATDVGGLRELVEDGTSGRLTVPKDPQALASALKEVLFDPRIARTYAHRALEDYVARFSRARMLQDLATIYRALAATSA